MHHKHKNTITK